VDRHLFDAFPDPNFRVQADPDPDPDAYWHQDNADPRADPTPCLHTLENPKFFLLLFTALP
jgi:hypothetical protein